METTLNLNSFDSNTSSQLLINIFDSLKGGHLIRVVCDFNPETLRRTFLNSHAQNLYWQVLKLDSKSWEIHLGKLKEQGQGDCCGVCGGSSHK